MIEIYQEIMELPHISPKWGKFKSNRIGIFNSWYCPECKNLINPTNDVKWCDKCGAIFVEQKEWD